MVESTRPMVTVAMITYMHESFIAEAIDGVLMQQCDFDVELIIADDCSPDNTKFVVEGFKEHPNYKWINYIRHDNNKGMMGNFMWALKQASGKYIALCEGDDYWTDSLKLQKQVDFLEGNEEYVMCGSCAQVIKDGFAGNIIKPTKQRLDLIDGIEGNNFPTCTILFKSDSLENFQNNIKGLGDFLLQAHVLTYGSGYCFDEIMACYRVHNGGVWSLKSNRNKNTLLLLTYIEIFKKYYKYHCKYQIIRISKINTADIDKIDKNFYVYLMLFRIMHFHYRCYNFFNKTQ